MRWPWSRAVSPESVDLDAIDLDALEVVELDADGRLSGPGPDRTSVERMHESAYAPAPDGTGLAGIWEALGAEG